MAILDLYDKAAPDFKLKNKTVGDILTGDGGLLSYVFVIAGIVMLVMLVMGGIGLMTSGGNPDKTKASYSRIINALIGFLIIFVAYFVAQLIEVMLGITFL
jgi:Type IV secretion system pilin